MNNQNNKLPLCVLAVTLSLVTWGCISCSSTPYIKEQALHSSYQNSTPSILNRARISEPSRQTLRSMQQKQDLTPSTLNERIAIAEQAIAQTKKSSSHNEGTAMAYYLSATEALWPIIKNSPTLTNPNSSQAEGEQTRLVLAQELYTHAAGQIARIAQHYTPPQSRKKSIQVGDKTLQINTASPHTFHPSFFDAIRPLDRYIYGNIGAHHHKIKGIGAPLVGHRSRSPQRQKRTPLMPPNGMDLPVNAIVDYPRPHQPRLTLTNLLETTTTGITGKREVLAADYSAPLAAIASTQSSNLGLSLAVSSRDNQDNMGLFALAPYDPYKIPIIMVHGLVSQPSTWTTVTNYLVSDPILRKNYQLLYYFYPTSYPAMISGAKFRMALLDFYKNHAHEHHSKLNQTVLIGHSMGGLLSSIQSRTFDQNLWNQLFEKSPEEQGRNAAYSQIKVLFENPTLTPIRRTIFIATPHRGSKLASNWIGKMGSSLIKLPQSMLSLQADTTAKSMTNFGRSLINQGPLNSVTQLKPHNPVLELLTKQKFNSRVTFHSIIGDRGKGGELTKSSDGVVPYWSSHLDGAASEKIVPTNHEAHLHPEAHKELARILHLHLQSKNK